MICLSLSKCATRPSAVVVNCSGFPKFSSKGLSLCVERYRLTGFPTEHRRVYPLVLDCHPRALRCGLDLLRECGVEIRLTGPNDAGRHYRDSAESRRARANRSMDDLVSIGWFSVAAIARRASLGISPRRRRPRR